MTWDLEIGLGLGIRTEACQFIFFNTTKIMTLFTNQHRFGCKMHILSVMHNTQCSVICTYSTNHKNYKIDIKNWILMVGYGMVLCIDQENKNLFGPLFKRRKFIFLRMVP